MIAPGSVQTVASPDDATLVIPITGMTCTACEDRVRRAIAATPGIIRAEVSFVARSARVTLEAPESQLAAALDAIRTAGYEPTATVEHILAHRTAAARLELDRQRRDASLAVLALAIAVLQLLFGMPFMAHGGALAPSLAGPAMHPMLRSVLCLSTLLVIVIARGLFARAWSAMKRRTADMSTLVALGSGTAFLYSTAATAFPAWFAADARLPDVHFEAASFLLALALVGRALEERATTRTTSAQASLAEAARLLAAAQASRPPIQSLADRVAASFVPAVLTVATLAALVWSFLGPEPRLVHALTTFVTVVVVSCPCALGLATPTAVATAIGRAAQLGVLVRSGDALERLAQTDTVAFDKTATLTEGGPVVVDFTAISGADVDELFRLAAAIERGSEHPVGEAIVTEAIERGLDIPVASTFIATASDGTRAEVEGHDVRVGSMAWLGAEGITMPEGPLPDAAFGIAIDGMLSGHGTVADSLLDEAPAAVARLRAMGVRMVILTSDRQEVARAIGAALLIDDVRSELDQEEKLEALATLEQEGRRVAMCGDGVNDAPALARAHVGIAIGSGAGKAAHPSDVTLLTGGVALLPDAVALARQTMRVVRRNLAFAFATNVALVPIAAGALAPWLGYRMPPCLASLAMALSTIGVVLSSSRLRRFEPLG